MGVSDEIFGVVLGVIVLPAIKTWRSRGIYFAALAVGCLYHPACPPFAFDMNEIDSALAKIKKEELGLVYGD